MKHFAATIVAAVLCLQGTAFSQAGDVNKILADARAALGGETKLAAVKTLAATGQATRVTDNSSSAPADVELAFELPDKFMKTDVVAILPNAAVTRTTGFNGDKAIDVIDKPPTAGNIVIRMGGPGEGEGSTQTPEQREAQQRAKLVSNKQELARVTLGMLLPSLATYPLEFSYGGQAESPDGKADIVDVKGEGEFAVRLFIDTKTHLPLMLSWMAKEPLVIKRTFGGPGMAGGHAPGDAKVGPGHAAQGGPPPKMTPEQMEKMKQETAEQVKAAESKLRTVEYRLYYSDYRDVDGVKVSFTLQRAIDGKPVEQVAFDKVKINGKVDPKKFEVK